MTLMSSSPSSSVSARMPLVRMLRSAESAMRLTVPLRVAKTRNESSSISRTCSMALTFSSFSTWMKLTMFTPRAVRPASGMR